MGERHSSFSIQMPRNGYSPIISLFLTFSFIFALLFTFLHYLQSQTSEFGRPSPLRGAYAIVICGEKNVRPALLLLHSLKQTRTKKSILCLTLELSDKSKELLRRLGGETFEKSVHELRNHDFGNFFSSGTHSNADFFSNSSSNCLLSKITIWKFEQFDKIVILDPTMIVFQNIDELFDRPEPSGVADYDLPGRMNPSLMVIKPSSKTFSNLTRTLSDVHERLKPGIAEIVFFNYAFFSWPDLGPSHRLRYGYNAQSRLAYSATWNEWVSPNLKAAQFPESSDDYRIDWEKLYPAARKYEKRRWTLIRQMVSALSGVKSGIIRNSVKQAVCHGDYTSFGQGKLKNGKFSVIVHAHGFVNPLKSIVLRLRRLNQVEKIFVLPVNKFALKVMPKEFLTKYKAVIISPGRFTVSHRFLPVRGVSTDCILLIEDTVSFDTQYVLSGFKVWQNHPHRLVGFFPSSHYRAGHNESGLIHVESAQRYFSMVSARLLFLHIDYLQDYSCALSPELRFYIDKIKSCEEIALNFLVAQKTKLPPILIFDPEALTSNLGSSKLIANRVASFSQSDGMATPKIRRAAANDSQLDLTHLTFDQLSSNLLAFRADHSEKSQCMNDIKAFFNNEVPVFNATEARSRLKRDLMTKISFSAWNQTALFFPTKKQPLARSSTSRSEVDSDIIFEPVFSLPKDEVHPSLNPKNFMKNFPSMGITPEVFIMPSLEFPSHVVCLRGNSSSKYCISGHFCNNSYVVFPMHKIPENSTLVLGSTAIVHGLSPSLDHFHSLNLFSNFFFSFQGYSFFQPARIIYFIRGGFVESFDRWTLDLFRALFGDSVMPYVPPSDSDLTCFQKVIISRRYRKDIDERRLVTKAFRDKLVSYCTSTSATSATVATATSGTLEQGDNGEKIRVFFLHDNDRVFASNPIANLKPLINTLQSVCKLENDCELEVLDAKHFVHLCPQVIRMSSSDIFITVSRKLMHNMIFMQSGKHVLELMAHGLRGFDYRINKVNRELSTWMNLKHSSVIEMDSPQCTKECSTFYQSRPFVVDKYSVANWLSITLNLVKESSKVIDTTME